MVLVRTLDELEGWKLLFTERALVGLYGCYSSPDESKLALVHMGDREITLIYNRIKKEVEYVHPTTQRGAEIVGVDVTKLFRGMR